MRGVEPQLAQFFAHGDHGVQRRVRGTHLGQLGQGLRRHFLGVAVQPALGGLEHGHIAMARLQGSHFILARLAHTPGIACHHFVAVGDQGFQRFLIGHRLGGTQLQLGRYLLHRGPAHFLHQADVQPANVEFKRLDRELGRRGVGVVVVVQLFPANQDAPGREIGAGVLRLEVAVAPVVAHAVDHPGCPERNPDHLHRPHGSACSAEQGQIQNQHQAHTLPAKAAVHVALHPVIGGAMAKFLEGFGVFGLSTVQLGAAPHHGIQPTGLRAVWVVRRFALGVVLAVNGHPFLGLHARAHPEPETEEMRRNGVQLQRPVGLCTVQEDRHGSDGDVRRDQRVQHDLPPGQVPQAMAQPINDGVQHRPIR